MRYVDLPNERDRGDALGLVPVSRETAERFDCIVAELVRWQAVKNLVGASTLSTVWTRHVADSAQLLALVPGARRWIDLGAGAGFPGLIIAAMLADVSGADIHLVESNARKAAFLRETARRISLPVVVHTDRIESVTPRLSIDFDAVSARALAPLPQLLDLSSELLKKGAVGVFPKGRNGEAELTEASQSWIVDASAVPSLVDSTSSVLLVRSAIPRRAS
jgi:16S rRNA (guanine527-N7)-methyltransferase